MSGVLESPSALQGRSSVRDEPDAHDTGARSRATGPGSCALARATAPGLGTGRRCRWSLASGPSRPPPSSLAASTADRRPLRQRCPCEDRLGARPQHRREQLARLAFVGCRRRSCRSEVVAERVTILTRSASRLLPAATGSGLRCRCSGVGPWIIAAHERQDHAPPRMCARSLGVLERGSRPEGRRAAAIPSRLDSSATVGCAAATVTVSPTHRPAAGSVGPPLRSSRDRFRSAAVRIEDRGRGRNVAVSLGNRGLGIGQQVACDHFPGRATLVAETRRRGF
jgi:hypothetical protein